MLHHGVAGAFQGDPHLTIVLWCDLKKASKNKQVKNIWILQTKNIIVNSDPG